MDNTNATDTWQTCMIALDCGDLAGAEGVRKAITEDHNTSAVMDAKGDALKFALYAYAGMMELAIKSRSAGDIALARTHESDAQRIYRKIPKAWRW